MTTAQGPLQGPIRGNVTGIGDLPQKIVDGYIVHVSKLLADDLPEVPWLVTGCIPRGAIVLLTGESGIGKSFVAYELARAVASGTQWMGRGPALAQPETVLMLNYDNSTQVLKARIIKMGFKADHKCFIHTQGMGGDRRGGPEMLKLPAEKTRINHILQTIKPSLILFDSFRQGQTMDENSNQDMQQLMEVFKGWTQQPWKPAAVLIHHTSKNTQTNAWQTNSRGSGEVPASSDVVMEVIVEKEKKIVRWTKTRGWEPGRTKETTIEIVDQWIDSEGNVEDDDDDKVKKKPVAQEEDDAEFDDDLIVQRTTVRATTPLPGEGERLDLKLVTDVFKKRCGLKLTNDRGLILAEIQKAIPGMTVTNIKGALRQLRGSGLVRFSRTKIGRCWIGTEKLAGLP